MAEFEKQPEYLIEYARKNRGNLSLPEKLLWKRLKQPANVELKIRRQYPILGKYIIDFFYEDLQLAIEVDGSFIHAHQGEADARRQAEIESTGIAFLRIPARLILQDPDATASLVLNICRGEILLDDLEPCLL